MTRDEHIRLIAMEECVEIAHRISKALRFGMNELQPGQFLNNRERIENELTDLLTTLDMAGIIQLDHEGCYQIDAVGQGNKQRKIEKYLTYAREQGTLTP